MSSPTPIELAVQEGQQNHTLFLEQAQDLKGTKWEVTVIKAGLSLNGVDYEEKVLKENLNVFDNVPANAIEVNPDFFNHLELMQASGILPAFPVGNTVGVLSNPFWDARAHAVKGTFTFLTDPFSESIREKVFSASKVGKKNVLGLSIRVIGKFAKAIKNGFAIRKLLSIEKVGAWVDIVSRPAAGGQFERALASQGSLSMNGLTLASHQVFADSLRVALGKMGLAEPTIEQIVSMAVNLAKHTIPGYADPNMMKPLNESEQAFIAEFSDVLADGLKGVVAEEQIAPVVEAVKVAIVGPKSADGSSQLTLQMVVVPKDELKSIIQQIVKESLMSETTNKPEEQKKETLAVQPQVTQESVDAIKNDLEKLKAEKAELEKKLQDQEHKLGAANTQRLLMESLPDYKLPPSAVADLKADLADAVLNKEELDKILKAKREFVDNVLKESVSTVRVKDNVPDDEASKKVMRERAQKALIAIGAADPVK